MSKKFQILVLDCPWSFGDKLRMSSVKRGAQANYPTMTNEEIMQLPIQEIADPEGAVLCLWVPSSLIETGLEVMKTYGFALKQNYIWCKTKKEPLVDVRKSFNKSVRQFLKNENKKTLTASEVKKLFNQAADGFSLENATSFGMGRITRACHEICLIGINNTKIYKKLQNKSQRSVSFAQNLKHSSKPDCLQDSLDKMFPDAEKIEIFSRKERQGWISIGNEAKMTYGEDVRESLKKLIEEV